VTRLLVCAPYLWPRIGGMENLATSLTLGLSETFGYECLALSSSWEPLSHLRHVNGPLSIRQLPFDLKVFSTPIGFKWKSYFKRVIREFQPHVVMAHTPVPFFADMAVRAAISENVPSILMYHGDLAGESIAQSAAAWAYQLVLGSWTLDYCDIIFVTSSHYARSSREISRRLAKTVVVPPFVDSMKFRPHSQSLLRDRYGIGNAPMILFVGQLERESRRRKGLDVLLQSMAIIFRRNPSVHLVIVGDGAARPDYEARSRRLGISSNTHFAGRIPHSHMPVVFSEATVLCLPSCSRAESFGMVLLEAQACGTPVVGSRIGGIPAAVKDSETGLLVRPGDASELADTLAAMCSNVRLAKEMGRRAREFVQTEFSAERSLSIADAAIRTLTKRDHQ